MEPTQLGQHSKICQCLWRLEPLHCKITIVIRIFIHKLNLYYINEYKHRKPSNVYDKKCRLSFSRICFSPVFLPISLTFPAAGILVIRTTYLVALIIECRLCRGRLFSNICYTSFIWVPRDTLKPTISQNKTPKHKLITKKKQQLESTKTTQNTWVTKRTCERIQVLRSQDMTILDERVMLIFLFLKKVYIALKKN